MQFTILIIAVVALAASAFAGPVPATGPILYCGGQPYYQDEYTCYNTPSPPLLCPITYLRCGPDCYLPSQYGCSGGKLTPPTSPPSSPSCNGQVYDPAHYVCNEGKYLCNKSAPLSCGLACYKASEYKCVNGVLKHV